MDVAKWLPLSIRPRVDESAVNSDWAPREAAVRAAVVAQLGVALGTTERHGIRALVDTVVDAYVLAEGRPLDLDATTTGAVALSLLQRAPLERRAALRGRRIVATDAGWEIGAGRELRATAAQIVTFLAGRGPFPGS